MEPPVERGPDDKPRITAEEADARFAALVAEYRGGSRKRPSRARAAASNGPVPPVAEASALAATRDASQVSGTDASGSSRATLAFVAVFVAGFVVGVAGHGRPLVALLFGLPLAIVVRALYRRWRRDGDRGIGRTAR